MELDHIRRSPPPPKKESSGGQPGSEDKGRAFINQDKTGVGDSCLLAMHAWQTHLVGQLEDDQKFKAFKEAEQMEPLKRLVFRVVAKTSSSAASADMLRSFSP